MPPVDDAKLAETMAKYYPGLVCKYYPDYPSYTPPPTSKPSRLKESMVALADTMAKIELASKRLAASTANLVPISTKTTTLISTITRSEHDKLVGSYDPDPILRSRSCKDKNDPSEALRLKKRILNESQSGFGGASRSNEAPG
ncbi:hypothetical protein Tco_0845927 [Tanacetum coccineum]